MHIASSVTLSILSSMQKEIETLALIDGSLSEDLIILQEIRRIDQ